MNIVVCLIWFSFHFGCGAEIKPTASYDTIVVGLGAAGATAASTLARAGRRVLALEAQGRVGGRVRTERFGDGVVEVGAEWIHGQHPSRVYDLAVQNNVSLITQDLNFDVYRSDGSRKDVELLYQLTMYCANLSDQMSDRTESVRDFVTRNFKVYLEKNNPALLNDKEFVENFLEFINIMVNNYAASYDWSDVSAVSDYKHIEGDLHTSWHRHGYKTYFEILLNTYNNGPGLPTLDIKLNKEVTNIKWLRDGAGDVTVTTSDGDVYSAPNVIVTVSLGVLKERHTTLFSPALPEEKIVAIDTISMGLLDKIILSFDTVWFPSCMALYWTVEDKKKLAPEDWWMEKIVDASTPSGSSNTLTLWIYGESAKLVETLPEDVVKRKVVELLQMFMGANVTVPQPTAILRSTWYSNPYTRGSYTYDNMKMPSHPGVRDTLASPLLDSTGTPRVLYAGEATETTHYGTVHGASDSGYRAATTLLSSKI